MEFPLQHFRFDAIEKRRVLLRKVSESMETRVHPHKLPVRATCIVEQSLPQTGALDTSP